MKTIKQLKEQIDKTTTRVVKGQSPLDLRSKDEKMTALKKQGELFKKYNLYKKP